MSSGSDHPGPPVTRVSLLQVAVAAGVSAMTASRALGNRGRIAGATQERVLRCAQALGYRPDPEIVRLMHHLRNRRTQRFQSVLVGITTRPANEREFFVRTLIAGVEAQAARRGYSFEVMAVAPSPAGWKGVGRTLRSRGVQGLLLLPLQAPTDLDGLLDWNEFSVVAATASAIHPAVHRVMPHHFANTLQLCRCLAQRGYARIGLIVAADHDLRSEHGFTAAVTWHGRNESRNAVPPLVTTGASAGAIRAWYAREKPDAIITNAPRAARECAQILERPLDGPPRFAVTSLAPERREGLCGIDERPAAIGEAAVDLLAGLVERRVRGRPESPASTLLAGRWVE